MKRIVFFHFFFLSAILIPLSLSAQERGTPEEAKTMLQKAVAHYKAVGRVRAIADFNAKKAPFFDRDLYVFCIGPNLKISANGGFPSYVGRPVDDLKDAEGNPIGKPLLDAATSAAEGSVQYRWLNPATQKVESKISFVQKVGDDICSVGAYKP